MTQDLRCIGSGRTSGTDRTMILKGYMKQCVCGRDLWKLFNNPHHLTSRSLNDSHKLCSPAVTAVAAVIEAPTSRHAQPQCHAYVAPTYSGPGVEPSSKKEGISMHNVGQQARTAVLQIASGNTPLFMTTLSIDILQPKSVQHRKSVMQLVIFLIHKVRTRTVLCAL